MARSMLDRVRAYLRAHRPDFTDICEATGLKESWMVKVAYGRIPDPGVTKIEKVDAYRRREQRRKRRPRRNGDAATPQSPQIPSHH